MKKEIWRPVVGYEGLYEVSNFGRVKSVDRYENNHFLNGVKTKYLRKGKILKPQKKTSGHYQVCLRKNGKYYYLQLHRVVAMAFQDICGHYFDGAVVDHIDTNPANNAAANLRWCTTKENANNPITIGKNRANHKKQYVKIICFKDGVKYKTFDSIRQAAEFFHMKSTASITNCLCGRANSGYGYSWYYA